MADVSHTNPETGEAFGDSQVFERGKIAVVDGGSSGCRPSVDGSEADTEPDANGDHEDEPMGEIDHTPRKDAPDVNEVYDRGAEAESAGESDPDETDAEADE